MKNLSRPGECGLRPGSVTKSLHRFSYALRLIVFGLCAVNASAFSAQPHTLELVATIPLRAVKGRIDHLAFDADRRRLFIAALGNDTVEVFHVAANRLETSLKGFGEPQGIAYVPATNAVYVANGSSNRLDLLDVASLRIRKSFAALVDADNVRYDERARQIYVGYGKGALRAVNIDTGENTADIRLSGHPESFQLEQAAARIFVNVPTSQHVAVVDRGRNAVIATWSTAGAASNFPLAETSRLYVAAPAGLGASAKLLVYEAR